MLLNATCRSYFVNANNVDFDEMIQLIRAKEIFQSHLVQQPAKKPSSDPILEPHPTHPHPCRSFVCFENIMSLYRLVVVLNDEDEVINLDAINVEIGHIFAHLSLHFKSKVQFKATRCRCVIYSMKFIRSKY